MQIDDNVGRDCLIFIKYTLKNKVNFTIINVFKKKFNINFQGNNLILTLFAWQRTCLLPQILEHFLPLHLHLYQIVTLHVRSSALRLRAALVVDVFGVGARCVRDVFGVCWS